MYRGKLLKKGGLGQFANLRGEGDGGTGLPKNRGGGVFLRGGGGVTTMHTMV